MELLSFPFVPSSSAWIKWSLLAAEIILNTTSYSAFEYGVLYNSTQLSPPDQVPVNLDLLLHVSAANSHPSDDSLSATSFYSFPMSSIEGPPRITLLVANPAFKSSIGKHPPDETNLSRSRSHGNPSRDAVQHHQELLVRHRAGTVVLLLKD